MLPSDVPAQKGEVMQSEVEIIAPLKTRRQYTDREKAEALALLDINDGNFYRTARELAMPRHTLIRWANGEGINRDVLLLQQQKTLEYGGRFGELLEVILDSITPEDLEKASLKDKFISAAVAFDKRQLAYGQPTQINESIKDNLEAVLARWIAAAAKRGHTVTRDEAVAKMIELRPETRRYLTE